jgi:hypothetical protein
MIQELSEQRNCAAFRWVPPHYYSGMSSSKLYRESISKEVICYYIESIYLAAAL